MGFQVVLTEDAERDLDDIVSYIAKHDSAGSAEHVLSRILEIAERLTAAPTRGSQPKELRSLGDQEYRHVFFKPYRLIYRIVGQQVYLSHRRWAREYAVTVGATTARRLTLRDHCPPQLHREEWVESHAADGCDERYRASPQST
jgi:toxin ParE1/3/4